MFISLIRMNGFKPAFSFLKGRDRGETHVTLIQEMNSQWEVSLSIYHPWCRIGRWVGGVSKILRAHDQQGP